VDQRGDIVKKIVYAMLVGVFLMAAEAAADSIVVPHPLESPVSIDLSSNPVVTFGTRTIDFTPFLDQQFINFLPVGSTLSETAPLFRFTIALRARDGLADLTGMFPPSPVSGFVNQVPSFNHGTMNLLAFDVIIPGSGTPFSVFLKDLRGASNTATFGSPVPEPTSLLLVATALGLLAARRRAKGERPLF